MIGFLVDDVDGLTRLVVALTSLVGAVGSLFAYRQARQNGTSQAVTAGRVQDLHDCVDANHAETVGQLARLERGATARAVVVDQKLEEIGQAVVSPPA